MRRCPLPPFDVLMVGVLLLFTGGARAQDDPDPGELRARLRAQHVLVDEAVDEASVRALWAAFTSLPDRARAFPGGPLAFGWRGEELTALGMGDGSRALPEWEEGRRRFLLYELPAVTSPEQAALWRRRALVHAVVRRWEWAHDWSRTFPSARPSRERGEDSRALDLVTFAEELLVPDPQAPADSQAACEAPSRARFVFEKLGALPSHPARCEAFLAWARPQDLSHHELLFALPTGKRPVLPFGQLLLRPVHREAPSRPAGPSPEVRGGPGFVAHLPEASEHSLRRRFWLGLFGGYRRQVTSEGLEDDPRTLRRFRLRLSGDENLRLLERLWELEQRGDDRYWLLTQNGATWVADAVEVAVGDARRVRLPWLPPWLPGNVLDALARAELIEEVLAPLLAEDEPAPASLFTGGVQRSGLAPLSIGVGSRLDQGGEGPVMAWSSAFLRERFGEKRQHGVHPHRELRLIDTEVHWGLELPRPRLLRVDIYLAGLWVTPPGLGPGYGAEYRWLRRESLLDAVHQLRGGVMVNLLGHASGRAHLLFFLGPELRTWTDWRFRGVATGGFARLTGRVPLPGSVVNGLRVSAAWSPAWTWWRPDAPVGLGHEVEVDAMLHVTQSTARPWGLDAGLWMELEEDSSGQRVAGGVRVMAKVR